MKALVVYCHPVPESFNAAVRDRVLAALEKAGHDVRLIDLYAEAFDPVMGRDERRVYHDRGVNEEPVRRHLDQIQWCEMLVFVYPTWWYGLPAMLKGWVDRVFIPHVTFEMPEAGQAIRGRLTNIKRLGIVSTTGAPWWYLEWIIGNPGRRTILRGLRVLCARGCKTLWVSHDKMDHSTPESRAAFLDRVDRKLAAF